MIRRFPPCRAPRSAPALVPLLLLVLSACSASGESRRASEIDRLVQRGEYHEALRLARAEADERPGDEVAQERWRLASVAVLLEQGRRLSFDKRDAEALAKFEEAYAIAPDVRQVHDWREATLDKLADIWVTQAIEWHNSDDLTQASECYEKALSYRPDDSRAKNGLARVLIQLNYRRGMGDKYYQHGLEALQEYWLDQASHHFSATGKYDDDNERAKRRRAQADTLRAEERVVQAEELEASNQFAAARNEYRLATLFDPEHKPAIEGLERTRVEEIAAEKLRECERRVLRRQFDEALKALEEGAAITQRQGEAFAAERERLNAARLMVDYEAARAMEVDHRYEEAIARYEALIAVSAQGFFEDALARRDTLVDLVAKAVRYYGEAQTATDPAAKLALLRQVLLVYPEYKDARAQAAALEAPPAPAPKPEEPR